MSDTTTSPFGAETGSAPALTENASSCAEAPALTALEATTAMAALRGAVAAFRGLPLPAADHDDWLGPERIQFHWPPPPAARAFMSNARSLREALGRDDFQILQQAGYADLEIDAALIFVARQAAQEPYDGGVHGDFAADDTFRLGPYERVACCRNLPDPTPEHPHGHARHARTPGHVACLLQVDLARLERLARVVGGLQSTSAHQRLAALRLLRDSSQV
ncbi:MAG: hypothetical protein AVDCRST_MAG15-806 [uncultured Rubellimicrobium sp.]|uniref:Uncharacterized protein n=1 Tax=uncultured Rubellimicrobium sp. TaxID=543078 RepID=A0A6J4NU64_9RHOB|nr:MAG: hypothetical protein AVDCRST_MAG15-806 [uncultured Rubellimicrobium sp.]